MAFTRRQVAFLAFVAGVFVAAFVALKYPIFSPGHVYSLGLLGIIIGLLNIEAKEVWPYIVASIAFLVASTAFMTVLDILPVVSQFLERFVQALIYVVAPGVAVISLRIIYEASKSPESLPHLLREEKEERVKKPVRKVAKKRKR